MIAIMQRVRQKWNHLCFMLFFGFFSHKQIFYEAIASLSRPMRLSDWLLGGASNQSESRVGRLDEAIASFSRLTLLSNWLLGGPNVEWTQEVSPPQPAWGCNLTFAWTARLHHRGTQLLTWWGPPPNAEELVKHLSKVPSRGSLRLVPLQPRQCP